MSRLIIHYALPLLLPLAIYMTYMWYRRGRAKSRGDEIPAIEKTHVFVSVFTGFVLMIGALVWVALATGENPGEGEYQSPRFEDGKIVPPSFK